MCLEYSCEKYSLIIQKVTNSHFEIELNVNLSNLARSKTETETFVWFGSNFRQGTVERYWNLEIC